MDMCLGRCDDAQVVGFGEIDVAVNITLRVDDDRLARFLATDEVGGLRELVVVNHAHEHGRLLGGP